MTARVPLAYQGHATEAARRMWKLLFDWPDLASRGADAATYFVFAAVGTILFLLRLVLALFVGDADFADGDVGDVGHSDASFTMFSLLSVMAFVMGTGWMGLACRVDWGWGRVASAVTAVGFGTFMMGLASGLMYGARRLNQEIAYDASTAVGAIGRVYLRVPAHGRGEGQVEVTVSGRKKIMRAVSAGDAIPAFTDVRIVRAREDEALVVTPLE